MKVKEEKIPKRKFKNSILYKCKYYTKQLQRLDKNSGTPQNRVPISKKQYELYSIVY